MRPTFMVIFIVLQTKLICHLGLSAITYKKISTQDQYEGRLSFLPTETERRAFLTQMEKKMADYVGSIKEETVRYLEKYSLSSFKTFDIEREVSFQRSGNRLWIGTFGLKNGMVKDISKINLTGNVDVVYGEMDALYTYNLNPWKYLKVTNNYSILKNGRGFKGKIETQFEDFNYTIIARLDLKNKSLEMEEFRLNSIGHIETEIFGLNRNLVWLIKGMKNITMEIHKRIVLEEVQKTIRKALKYTIAEKSAANYLPQLDYGSEIVEDAKDDSEIPTDGTKSLYNDKEADNCELDFGMPSFIQNHAELSSFRKQLELGISNYMDTVIMYNNKQLIDRELGRAIIPDYVVSFDSKDDINNTLILENGILFGINNMMNLGNAQCIKFQDKMVTFSINVFLLNSIKFSQDFKARIENTDAEGSINGRVENIAYVIKAVIDMENKKVTAEEFQLKGMSDIVVDVIGLDEGQQWMTEKISTAANEIFKGPVWRDMDSIIRRALKFSISKNYVWSFLPKWNYKFTYGVGNRNAEEGSVDICESSFLESIQNKDENITAVEQLSTVPYIKVYAQRWYFEALLKKAANDYLRRIVLQACNIMIDRGLKRVKMPSYSKIIYKKDDIEEILTFSNGWIENLHSLKVGFVDHISYDSKELVFTSDNEINSNLYFEDEFELGNTQKKVYNGKIEGNASSIVYFMKLRVDYLGNKIVTLEKLSLLCVGGVVTTVITDEPLGNTTNQHISDAVSEMIKTFIQKDITEMLSRSIEDALEKINITLSLPKWDYKSIDWNGSFKLNESQENNLHRCPYEFPAELVIAPNKDERFVDVQDYLTHIKVVALRETFLENVNYKIRLYIMSMAYQLMYPPFIPQDLYVRSRLMDRSQTFISKDDDGTKQQVTISWFDGILQDVAPVYDFDLRDTKFGENGSIYLLHSQAWEKLKISYRLNIKFPYITKKARIEGIIKVPLAVMKSMYNPFVNKFAIEDYTIHCSDGIQLDIQGLGEQYSWVSDEIHNRTMKMLEESVMTEMTTILRDKYERYVKKSEIHMKYNVPNWIYYKPIYALAIEEADYLNESSVESAKNCTLDRTSENPPTVNQNVTYIGSEGEWLSFEEILRKRMKKYSSYIRDQASNFIVNNLVYPGENKLPVRVREFAISVNHQDSEGNLWKGDLHLKDGQMENSRQFEYDFINFLELNGMDILIKSPITFFNETEVDFSYSLNIMGKNFTGRVNGTVKSVIYEYVARINIENKTSKLENFRPMCVGDIDLDITPNDIDLEIEYEIVNKGTKEAISTVMEQDMKILVQMAIEYGILMYPDVSEYIPEWNYN